MMLIYYIEKNIYIYVGLSLEFRARNNSSLELAIVLLNRNYIYKCKNDFYKV